MNFSYFIEWEVERIGCRSVNSLLNPPIPFRFWEGIFTLLSFHKTRCLRLLSGCGIWNFSYFIEGEGKRIGCRSVNSLLNPSIPFCVWGGIFIILYSHKTRGLRSFIDWENMNFKYFVEGKEERTERSSVNSLLNPPIPFVFEEVYLLYYFLSKREVYIHLFNEKLRISSILGWGKNDMQVSHFSVKAIDWF